MTEQLPPIHLKQWNQSLESFLLAVLFGSMYGLPVAILWLATAVFFVAKGQWHRLPECGTAALVFALILIALGAIAAMIQRLSQRRPAKHRLVLHPDRIVFPRRNGREVVWADVQAIEWPKRKKHSANVLLTVPTGSEWPTGEVFIDLWKISPVDQLTLIRYLRMAVSGIEEDGWPRFCRQRAIPLIEELQRREPTATPGNRQAWLATDFASLVRFVERRPFVGGTMSPLFLLLLALNIVRRKAWWTLATIFGLSGVATFAVLGGAWMSPFAEIWLAIVGALFLAGLISGKDLKPQKRGTRLSAFAGILALSWLLIAGPLVAKAQVLGWIPEPLVTASVWLFVIVIPLSLVCLDLARQQRQAPALEADAVRRWDHYVRTGVLPDAGPVEPVSDEPG